jgi:HK97 gp10 family phage protein
MATEIFRIDGLAELESKLSEIMALGRADQVARQTLVKAAKTAMEPVFYEVQSTAPYDAEKPRDARNPIHMRDTVKLEARIPNQTDRKSMMVNQTDAAIAVVSVKKSAVSLAQELGTKKLHAQPFLRPALARHKDNVVAAFKDELQTHINLIAAKQARRKK